MAEEQEKRPPRYVITVHGIGEQREYETVLPVINRFAEIRGRREIGDPLTLGSLASHLADEKWIEYDQIPCVATSASQPFVGRRTKTAGRNIRFVDMWWGNVMQQQFDLIGQSTAVWTRSMINRLESRAAPEWIVELLRTMRAGLLPLQKLLKLRLGAELSEKIFDRFLGDVQLYGEYGSTRGVAVRRFHEVMADLHENHEGNVPPAYAIIAHSLGSIMAFDALMFAHGARKTIRRKTTKRDAEQIVDVLDLEACSIEGYRRQTGQDDEGKPVFERDDQLPRLDWVEHVDAFVTLGSPIDKFLILWWLNYEHLRDTAWMDPGMLEKRAETPLRHYNYCDEQDPVGHELDVAYSSKAVQRIFGENPVEDRVFTRYSVPGVAHVKYWEDRHLFWRIVDLVVDGKAPHASEESAAGAQAAVQPDEQPEVAHPVEWFRFRVFLRSLCWSYLVIPVLGWLACSLLMIWAVNSAGGWSTRSPVLLASIGLLALTCWLQMLMVQWRQVMVSKRKHAAPLPPLQRVQRATARWTLRGLVVVLPLVWAWLLAGALHAASFAWIHKLHEWLPKSLHWIPTLFGKISCRSYVPEVADRIRDIPHTMRDWGLFPSDLTELTDRRVYSSIIIMLTFALLLGLWNAIVFLRMTWKWYGVDMRLSFGEYLDRDPSRPTQRRA